MKFREIREIKDERDEKILPDEEIIGDGYGEKDLEELIESARRSIKE